jgi:hypothetical protein
MMEWVDAGCSRLLRMSVVGCCGADYEEQVIFMMSDVLPSCKGADMGGFKSRVATVDFWLGVSREADVEAQWKLGGNAIA